MPSGGRVGAVKMAPDNSAVLARADALGEALQRAKDELDPDVFRLLLAECNATIRQVTRIEYGTVCAPAGGGCGCGGKC